MKRFFGMMPSDEIEIEKVYTDDSGFTCTIQAGPHGWSIIYSDLSSHYKDSDYDSETNFKKAYEIAVTAIGNLTEISSTIKEKLS